MAGVVLDRLTKQFGSTRAVDEVNVSVAPGEFVTLVGPSGCGKSTTLRMIAGLEAPTSGRILFDEREVTTLEPRDRNIAMVFQSYALYPHMTVRGNLEYGLRKRGVPAAERAVRVRETAAMLQIGELLDRKPRELSGGQRQRVALGRALIRKPEVFLLDEPLSNLDAKLRVHMRAELTALHQAVGVTMVYVTHDQLEAMTMSDRIVVMRHGRVQQIGTPEEVYGHPLNRFVAEFIGTPSMNFVPGTLAAGPAGLRFESPALGLGLPGRPALAANGHGVLLGIRPEDIQLVAPEAAGASAASVALVELAGPERFVFLDLGGARVIARWPASVRVGAGERVGIRFDPDKVHLFDQETEAAL